MTRRKLRIGRRGVSPRKPEAGSPGPAAGRHAGGRAGRRARGRGAGRRRSPADRALRVRGPFLLLAGAAACFLISRLVAHDPGLVEAVYGRRLGVWIPYALSWVTGWIPAPLGEILMAGGVIAYVYLGGRALIDVLRRRRRVRNALGGAGLRLAADVGVVGILFYVLWGFNYARAPLATRLGLPGGSGADTAEIASLAREEILATNAAYRRLHGSDDIGRPTRIEESREALRRGLESGWRAAVRQLDLPAELARERGPLKRFIPDRFLSSVGISGFFFPWTGEAIVDAGEPALLLPFDMEHEKAHQRGTGPENEASFLGWMAATRSPDPQVEYAGHAMAQLTFVSILARRDRDEARALVAERLPGVRRDIQDYFEFLRDVEVRAAAVATEHVNDAYLKANRVPGGVASYGRVAQLLVAWSRAHGGHLEAGAPPGPP